MKTLGYTESGGRIVEMTSDEHRAFELLQAAAIKHVRRSEMIYQVPQEAIDDDMVQTFQIIRLFCETQFVINNLRDVVGFFDKLTIPS